MRISERGMTRTVLTDLMSNRSRLERLHEQLSSGSRINRPSDDPGGTVTYMNIESTLSELEQFRSNTSLARDWLNATESALNETTDLVHRLRELGVRGSTDTMPQESLDALAEEVSEIVDHLMAVANTRHVGRYIFGGYRTEAAPFHWVEDPVPGNHVSYSGDDGLITRRVGPGVEIQVNVPGDLQVGGADGGFFDNLLNTAADMRDALFAGDADGLDAGLGELDANQDEILAVRSQVGSRANRLDMSENRLEDMRISLTRVLSETADVDVAEAIMHLSMTERAYQVTLATGARILPQTLLDYLR